jgi:hypothetical protein
MKIRDYKDYDILNNSNELFWILYAQNIINDSMKFWDRMIFQGAI